MSATRQRLISAALIATAFGALILGVLYQDDNRLDEPSFVGIDDTSDDASTGGASGATASGGSGDGDSTATTLADDGPVDPAAAGGPIEGFLPEGGTAVACREPVGVDLRGGFGARLTINGRDVPEELMNVVLDDAGRVVANEVTASRSLGQFTFLPEDDCPNGEYLRPIDNVLEVCVFRFDDPARECTVTSRYVFDAA